MARVILVCGPTGVGKTTHALALSKEIGAVRFSIDPWMQTLFVKDMTSLDYDWILERVFRCHDQMWSVAGQIVGLGGNVVLDLAFGEKAHRERFRRLARGLGVEAELHCLDAPREVRRERVAKRNLERDPAVFAFEVTDMMFDFMEPRFEPPDEVELANGRRVAG